MVRFKKGDRVRIKEPEGGMNHYWVVFEMTPGERLAEKQQIFDIQKEDGEPVEWDDIMVVGKRFLGTGYTPEHAVQDVRSWASKYIAALTLDNVIEVVMVGDIW